MLDTLTPLTILYIEDEYEIRVYLEEYLKRRFENVIAAEDGSDGWHKFLDHAPDIVITDISMPLMDGIELTEKIRQINKEVPILVTTAFSDAEYLWQAINAGVTKYLKKPIQLQNFMRNLSEISEVILQKKELEKSHKIIEGISRSIGDALIVADKRGKVIFANDLASEMSEYVLGDMIEEEDERLFVRGMDINRIVSDVINFNKSETRLNSKSGKEHLVSISATPLIVDDRVEGIVIVFRDISEVKETQEKLLRAKEQEIELLNFKECYHVEEKENAFKKQLKIIEDDLSNIKIGNLFFETYYKPIEVMSGDTYGTVMLNENLHLFYIIDAMGKGLSASVTSIQSSSFISYEAREARKEGSFSLEKLVDSFCKFIRYKLIEYEMLCVSFVVIDLEKETFEYANFGMPPYLGLKTDGSVEEIFPNNAPIMEFFEDHQVDTLPFSAYRKILMYTDGIDECLMQGGANYASRIQKDFKSKDTLKKFIEGHEASVEKIQDDMTAIQIARYPDKFDDSFEEEIGISFEEIDKMVRKIASHWDLSGYSSSMLTNIQFVMNELLINAMEHGNLGICHDKKQELLMANSYDNFLADKMNLSENRNKKIGIQCRLLEMIDHALLMITIRDEGEGFNSAGFFKYMNFDENIRLHGRGILMSESYTDSICYTKKGNEVTVLKVLERE